MKKIFFLLLWMYANCLANDDDNGKYSFIQYFNNLEKKIVYKIIEKRKCQDYSLSCLLAKNETPLIKLYFSALKHGVKKTDFSSPSSLPADIQPYSEYINKIYETNSDINSLDEMGLSALHYAACLNNEEIINLLLEAGASMQHDKDLKFDPLTFAIILNFNSSIAPLVVAESKMRVSTEDPNNQYLSLYSYFSKEAKSLEDLIKLKGKDFNINSKDNYQNNYLIYAIISGNNDLLDALIAKNINLNDCNSFGMTALHFAAAYNREDMIVKLAKAGADINKTDTYNMTPIFYAIFNNNNNIFELLYSLGANILIEDKIEKSALVYLIEYMPEEVDYLNSQNFDFQKFTTKNSMSLVFYAYSVKLYDVVKKLFLDGNNINSTDSNGNTILMLASYDQNTDMVDFLIKNKADLNLQSKDGNTAMHYAVISDNQEIVKKLFDAKADFSIKNKLLFTPLTSAVMYLKPKSFIFLIDNLPEFKNDALAKNYNNLANNICTNVEYNYTTTCQSYVIKMYNTNKKTNKR